MRKITLSWQGPIRVPRLPSKAKQEVMAAPGVYLWTQKVGGKTIVYAGKARNILSRIQEHYAYLLGYFYYIRNEDGTKHYSPSDDYMFSFLNNIDESQGIIIAEAKRIRIFFASVDEILLRPVESLIVDRLFDEAQGDGRIECENGRREGYGANSPSLAVKSEYGASTQLVQRLLGTERLIGRPT